MQTFGSQNKKHVGVILQRSVLVLLLCCLPCWALFLNTQLILLLCRQDPAVSRWDGPPPGRMCPSRQKDGASQVQPLGIPKARNQAMCQERVKLSSADSPYLAHGITYPVLIWVTFR